VFFRRMRNALAVASLLCGFGVALAAPATAEDGRPVKTKVAPQYPELAKRMNVTGTVKLQVTVAPNGVVKNAKVIGGHPLLVDPAVAAVMKWKYEPAAEETVSTVEFRFDNNNQ